MIFAAVILVLDQLTKALIVANFQLGERKTLIDGFFNLTFVTNTGAAWGMLKGHGFILLLIALLVLLLSMFFMRAITEGFSERCFALFLVAGGIIGNSIDRIWRGEVIDFLDFHLAGHHWPAFNVADSAICVGVGILMLSFIARGKEKAEPENE